MGNELVKSESQEIANIDYEKLVRDYVISSKVPVNEAEIKLALEICKAQKLNPFLGEIYIIKPKADSKFMVVTNYLQYIKRGEESGRLNGFGVSVKRDEKGNLVSSEVTIYKKGWDMPFKWEVSYKEVAKPSSGNENNWNKMPEFMLKKVVIS